MESTRITGGNIISNISKVLVSFIEIKGIQRQSTANTCDPLIKSSDTYRNFCKSREELYQIFGANIKQKYIFIHIFIISSFADQKCCYVRFVNLKCEMRNFFEIANVFEFVILTSLSKV